MHTFLICVYTQGPETMGQKMQLSPKKVIECPQRGENLFLNHFI